LSLDIKTVIGEIGSEDEDKQGKYKFVTNETAPALTLLICKRMHVLLDHSAWLLTQLKSNLETSVVDSSIDDESHLIKVQNEMELDCFDSLGSLAEILAELTQTGFQEPAQAQGEGLIKLLQKFYKVMTSATKTLFASKRFPPPNYQRLVQFICKKVSTNVAPFLAHLQQSHGIEESKAKIKKEQSLLPNLIFQIERFEHFLIKLSASTKDKVDLTKWLSRSTMRDFQINRDELRRRTSTDKKKKREVVSILEE